MAYVLHIDDEPSIRALLRDMLEMLGYQVESASNMPAGLDSARSRKPDLILLDVMMPGMDGFAGCRELRSDPALRDVPVVMITALDSLDYVEKAFAAGANDYIIKPVQLLKLKAKIEKLVGPA